MTRIEKTVAAINREAKNISGNRLLEIHLVVVEGGQPIVDQLRPLRNQNHRDDLQAIQAKFEIMESRMRKQLGYLSIQTLGFVEEHHAYEVDEQFARYDIQKLAGRLSEYLDDGRQQITKAMQGDSSSMLPSEWFKEDLGARICDISIQARIPCVLFFCKKNYDFKGAKRLTSNEAGLIALLYSVVSQLACVLPTAPQRLRGWKRATSVYWMGPWRVFQLH
ncbi:hypothetical protein N0V84_004826 [Fusarium piperis]|uniref:Uncharacterized protein n=1 Tax=Fusarium piperis TaxID=1435070 RepID=A0A9W9BPJ2_9HYPO|nr:hypothetical protein N0V84_004826 [Fusarium piperis]